MGARRGSCHRRRQRLRGAWVSTFRCADVREMYDGEGYFLNSSVPRKYDYLEAGPRLVKS